MNPGDFFPVEPLPVVIEDFLYAAPTTPPAVVVPNRDELLPGVFKVSY